MIPISDGVCVARIPANWTDDGTGNGRTAAGHRFRLFGGRLADDAAWEQAVRLFVEQAQRRADATVTNGDGFVRVDDADGGFAHRVRLGDRYCDFRLVAAGRLIAADERAAAEAVLTTLAPANP